MQTVPEWVQHLDEMEYIEMSVEVRGTELKITQSPIRVDNKFSMEALKCINDSQYRCDAQDQFVL